LKYAQAAKYALTTPSKTFGTPFLVYPNKSSVFRSMTKGAGRGALVGAVFSADIALGEALYDEIKLMQSGGCQ